MKKTLVILAVTLIFLALGWFFFRTPKMADTPEALNGSPFGEAGGVNIPALGTGTGGEATTLEEKTVDTETKLFRISNTPTAGFIVFARETKSIVRYADRGTGHIFEVVMPDEGESGALTQQKITNNTLPQIYEAHFRPDGSMVVFRSLAEDSETIRNVNLTLTPSRATSTEALYSIIATNLRGDMDSLEVGNSNTLFYVLKGSGAIVSSGFNGESPRTLFSSIFKDWRLEKLGNGLLAYTKADSSAPGYAYSLSGGRAERLLGPLNGLSVIANPNGTKLLYSYTENDTQKLAVKTLSNSSSYEILPVSLAEKCTWSSKDMNIFFCGSPLNGVGKGEPENWYRGRTHFSDYLWKFNTATEIAELVAEPKTDSNLDLDISMAQTSPNDDFLFFINRYDLTLWAVRLK